ncbi:sulfite exporter TauE/SafE family protein [Marinobacterium weihaiense]|uniref:Sulfite exporter TauE/SafE family protein n=1 Tax=Marinobacterium weihaiense TaxID=2851016 RepID=A0ABS6M7V8_9GAMM|nr:sulfite exporter TauE/SafE family protein [Marinobacterium weihaiense]MBV0931976.1 sulfite exporter TauE/SafE family protein [Marinobacterium weihaiense]
MIDLPLLTSALLFGLAGSTHCVGMCGGIAGSVAMSQSAAAGRGVPLLVTFNTGRIASYAVAGFAMGQLGSLLTNNAELTLVLRSFAALIMITMGLYIAGWWQGAAYLERAGGVLWRRIRPLSRALLPADTLTKSLALGGLWGWLPCGLVYTTLLWSGTVAESPTGSAILMAAFGVGTLPAMLTTALLARQLHQLLQQQMTRHIAGTLVILFGIATLPWTLWLHHA